MADKRDTGPAALLFVIAVVTVTVCVNIGQSRRIDAMEKQNRLLRWRLYCIEFDIGLPMTNPPASFEPTPATAAREEGER